MSRVLKRVLSYGGTRTRLIFQLAVLLYRLTVRLSPPDKDDPIRPVSRSTLECRNVGRNLLVARSFLMKKLEKTPVVGDIATAAALVQAEVAVTRAGFSQRSMRKRRDA